MGQHKLIETFHPIGKETKKKKLPLVGLLAEMQNNSPLNFKKIITMRISKNNLRNKCVKLFELQRLN